MTKTTVKDLTEALKNLDENKEVRFVTSYSNDKIEIELIKELKDKGNEYYKIYL